jgi:GTP-binding protein Era
MPVAADAPNSADFRCGYVAIAGRPNVGKSTLLNRLVGQRVSITSRKAQTTRHRVTGIVTTPDAQVLFVDTPGFQTKHRSRLNDRMNRAGHGCLADVDASVIVIEAGRTTDADRAVIRLLPAGGPRHRRAQQDRSRQGARRDAAANGGDRRALPVRGLSSP